MYRYNNKNRHLIKDKNEKQVTLRGGHSWNKEGKKMKVKKVIRLMYFQYKNKYRIFKSVEITIRTELR
jgi:hypothetical protein